MSGALLDDLDGLSRVRCGGCPAEIVFAVTRGGRLMPLDPDPRDDGNVEVVGRGANGALVRVLSAEELALTQAGQEGLFEAPPRFVAHFVTCPSATRFRRGRTPTG